MEYGETVSGRFIIRHNRFVAEVEIDGRREVVHVKNTGRCRELLVPGAEVFLTVSGNPERKTKYDLIAVRKKRSGGDTLLINMDSQIPNGAVLEWLRNSTLFSPEARFRREVTYKDSRFDIYVEDGERRSFIEVKGVTLEKDGVAMFPDAPTERGVKHLNGLAGCVQEGYEAYVFFVIQMKGVAVFRPHDAMHPEFGDALRRAAAAGVKILAMDCRITPDTIAIDTPVEVRLSDRG